MVSRFPYEDRIGGLNVAALVQLVRNTGRKVTDRVRMVAGGWLMVDNPPSKVSAFRRMVGTFVLKAATPWQLVCDTVFKVSRAAQLVAIAVRKGAIARFNAGTHALKKANPDRMVSAASLAAADNQNGVCVQMHAAGPGAQVAGMVLDVATVPGLDVTNRA